MARPRMPPSQPIQIRIPVETHRILQEDWHAKGMFHTFHGYIVDLLREVADAIKEGKR